jgi:hypothetical protein
MMPTNKVTVSTFAGAFAAVLMWGLSLKGIQAPPGIESAITVIIMFVVGYVVPNHPDNTGVPE